MITFGFLTIWFFWLLIAGAFAFFLVWLRDEGAPSVEDRWEVARVKISGGHLVPIVAALAFGPVFWSDRVRLVGRVCGRFAEFGVQPMFCT